MSTPYKPPKPPPRPWELTPPAELPVVDTDSLYREHTPPPQTWRTMAPGAEVPGMDVTALLYRVPQPPPQVWRPLPPGDTQEGEDATAVMPRVRQPSVAPSPPPQPTRPSEKTEPATPDILAAAEERFSHVARNSIMMGVGTMGSRVLGFVRTFLFAMIVQASIAADAFTQANNLPTTIYAIIATGVVTGILIPQITKAMKRPDGGTDFVNRLLTLALLMMAVVAIVCTLATPWLINLILSEKANVATPGYLHLMILLGYWCMPQIFFYGLYAVLGQVLNARGHFTAFAWAPAWANVVQIGGLVWFWLMWGYQPDPANWSMQMIVVLGASTTLGIIVQGLCLIWPLYRDGFRYRPRFGWRGYGFGEVSRMTMWTLAAVVVSFVASLAMTWAATAMRAGVDEYAGNGTLQYAYTLFILPQSLVTVSIVTALFPGMSTAWADRDDSRMKDLLRQGLSTPAVLVIPSSIALIGLGMPMIRTLYGALSPVEATNVWWVTAAYALGGWAYSITALKQRYYFAKQDGWTNFWLTLVLTGTQLVLAFAALWLVPGRFGVMGIAVGQTIGAFLAAGIFLALVRRDLGSFGFGGISLLWTKVTVASVAAAFAGWDVYQALTYVSTSRLFAPIELVAGGIVFCLVFWLASALMRVTEVTSFVNSALSRFRRVSA